MRLGHSLTLPFLKSPLSCISKTNLLYGNFEPLRKQKRYCFLKFLYMLILLTRFELIMPVYNSTKIDLLGELGSVWEFIREWNGMEYNVFK